MHIQSIFVNIMQLKFTIENIKPNINVKHHYIKLHTLIICIYILIIILSIQLGFIIIIIHRAYKICSSKQVIFL